MKKFTPAVGLFLITLLFISCTSDTEENVDASTLSLIRGRWKLTESHTTSPASSTPIVNGYEIDFKDDGTFTSNEESGYNNGTYTVLKTPGTNLRLTFIKQWEAKLVYKYINAVTATNLYLQASTVEPAADGSSINEGYTLTRIP